MAIIQSRPGPPSKFIDLTPERVADLRELLRRGLNCWDPRPGWLVQLQTELQQEEIYNGHEK